jgi:hypothetical protein
MKRGKVQKAWIAILAFSLTVFVVLDLTILHYERVELRYSLSRMVMPFLMLSSITWATYRALLRRIGTPEK